MMSREQWAWMAGGLVVIFACAGSTYYLMSSMQESDTVQPSTTSQTTKPPKTPAQTNPSTDLGSPTDSGKTHTEDAPLYITTMTHMEGNFKDDEDENLFNKHVAMMRWAIALFDEYGAKLTFESEASFAKANTLWGTNILKEVVTHGHGVGTHADFGAGSRETLTLDQLTQNFKDNKGLVDALVGAENNRGVSGGTGPTDWVLAASTAGFDYIDAVTGFGYLSMAASERPEGWTDAYIRATAYHDPIPPEFSDRLYPLALQDATDLTADAHPAITMMGGDIGELASLAEGRVNCSPDCTFDAADIQVVIDAIKEADQIRDRMKFARINMHIPLVLLDQKNETLLRQLLAAIKTYTDNGTILWATQGASYDAYQAWEK